MRTHKDPNPQVIFLSNFIEDAAHMTASCQELFSTYPHDPRCMDLITQLKEALKKRAFSDIHRRLCYDLKDRWLGSLEDTMTAQRLHSSLANQTGTTASPEDKNLTRNAHSELQNLRAKIEMLTHPSFWRQFEEAIEHHDPLALEYELSTRVLDRSTQAYSRSLSLLVPKFHDTIEALETAIVQIHSDRTQAVTEAQQQACDAAEELFKSIISDLQEAANTFKLSETEETKPPLGILNHLIFRVQKSQQAAKIHTQINTYQTQLKHIASEIERKYETQVDNVGSEELSRFFRQEMERLRNPEQQASIDVTRIIADWRAANRAYLRCKQLEWSLSLHHATQGLKTFVQSAVTKGSYAIGYSLSKAYHLVMPDVQRKTSRALKEPDQPHLADPTSSHTQECAPEQTTERSSSLP